MSERATAVEPGRSRPRMNTMAGFGPLPTGSGRRSGRASARADIRKIGMRWRTLRRCTSRWPSEWRSSILIRRRIGRRIEGESVGGRRWVTSLPRVAEGGRSLSWVGRPANTATNRVNTAVVKKLPTPVLLAEDRQRVDDGAAIGRARSSRAPSVADPAVTASCRSQLRTYRYGCNS